eukprot:gene9033-9204_t
MATHADAATGSPYPAHSVEDAGDLRSILVVVSNDKQSEILLDVAAKEFYKPAFFQDAEKELAIEEHEGAVDLKRHIAATLGAHLDYYKIPYQVHILPDKTLKLGAHICKLADYFKASAVILPRSTSKLAAFEITVKCPLPVILV